MKNELPFISFSKTNEDITKTEAYGNVFIFIELLFNSGTENNDIRTAIIASASNILKHEGDKKTSDLIFKKAKIDKSIYSL